MALDRDSSYRYVGGGAALALEVSGPTMESCLARAIEGVAAAFSEVHPSITGHCIDVIVDRNTPAVMLRDVLDATTALREAGEVPVAVAGTELLDGRLVVSLEVVSAATARVTVDGSPALDWHHLALERRDGHWVGHLVADV